MVGVVADAIHRLTADQWWDTVRGALDAMPPAEVSGYQEEETRLDAAAADGLRAG